LFVDIIEVGACKSKVNVVKMPGDCRCNDSWTLSDVYTRQISQTKDVHEALIVWRRIVLAPKPWCRNVICTEARYMLCLKDIDIIAAWAKVLEN